MVLLFVIPFFSSFGQDSLCFTTTDTLGCAPYTVHVQNCATKGLPVSYAYNLPKDNRSKIDTFFTYTEPGEYIIGQYGDIGTANGIDTFYIEGLKIKVLSAHIESLDLAACADNELQITIGSSPYSEFTVNYGDGSQQDTIQASETKQYTYSDSLVKTVHIEANYLDVCALDTTFSFQPFTTLFPTSINWIEELNASNYQLKLKGASYYFHQLNSYQNDVLFKSIDPAFKNDSALVKILFNNVNSKFSFQASAYDACGNDTLSEYFNTIELQLQAKNDFNSLTWSNYDSLVEIIRNNASHINLDTSFYKDSLILCGEEYCYAAKTTVNKTNILSATHCVNAISQNEPQKIEHVIINIANEQLEVEWHPIVNYKELYINNLIFSDSSNMQLIDLDPSVGQHCLSLSYQDPCANYSDTTKACAIFLSLSDKQLNFLPYSGIDALEYILMIISETDTLEFKLATSQINTDTLDLPQSGFYLIKGVKEDISVYSNTIYFDSKNIISLPNAIAPNSVDAALFYPVGEYIKEYNIRIFTKNGNQITQLAQNEAWNGKSNNKNAEAGVYLYEIEITDYEQQTQLLQGTVTVVY